MNIRKPIKEQKKNQKRIFGIQFFLDRQGYVDYGMYSDGQFTYTVRPKRLTNNGYVDFSKKLKPTSLYQAIRRGNDHTILSVVSCKDNSLF